MKKLSLALCFVAITLHASPAAIKIDADIKHRIIQKIAQRYLTFFRERGTDFKNMQNIIYTLKNQRIRVGVSAKDLGKTGDLIKEHDSINEKIIEEVGRFNYYKGSMSDTEIESIVNKFPELTDFLEQVYKIIR